MMLANICCYKLSYFFGRKQATFFVKVVKVNGTRRVCEKCHPALAKASNSKVMPYKEAQLPPYGQTCIDVKIYKMLFLPDEKMPFF